VEQRIAWDDLPGPPAVGRANSRYTERSGFKRPYPGFASLVPTEFWVPGISAITLLTFGLSGWGL
jgi:hypothetical protein